MHELAKAAVTNRHEKPELMDKITEAVVDHYGPEEMTTVAMEECAELIQAISKHKRGEHDRQHLIEEMADVMICLENLKNIFGVSEDELNKWMVLKTIRNMNRAGIEPF